MKRFNIFLLLVMLTIMPYSAFAITLSDIYNGETAEISNMSVYNGAFTSKYTMKSTSSIDGPSLFSEECQDMFFPATIVGLRWRICTYIGKSNIAGEAFNRTCAVCGNNNHSSSYWNSSVFSSFSEYTIPIYTFDVDMPGVWSKIATGVFNIHPSTSKASINNYISKGDSNSLQTYYYPSKSPIIENVTCGNCNNSLGPLYSRVPYSLLPVHYNGGIPFSQEDETILGNSYTVNSSVALYELPTKIIYTSCDFVEGFYNHTDGSINADPTLRVSVPTEFIDCTFHQDFDASGPITIRGAKLLPGVNFTVEGVNLSPEMFEAIGNASLTFNSCSGTLDLSQWSGSSISGNGHSYYS